MCSVRLTSPMAEHTSHNILCIHEQESQVPSVLVFPSHCFITLAFSYILPVPPNSVTFNHTALWHYRNSTNRGLPVHWSHRSFEVSHRISTFTGPIIIAIFNGQAVPGVRKTVSECRWLPIKAVQHSRTVMINLPCGGSLHTSTEPPYMFPVLLVKHSLV
jgi:hypothetical protein